MTSRCFVAGQPIAHSRSPLIHGGWIAELGIDASYEKVECGAEGLPALLGRIRSGEFLGGNLTIPLKEAAPPLLDDLTEDARRMGAVNTVFRRDGRLVGANTDVAGYFAHLDQTCPDWRARPPRVLLLGAGGAARAIAWGLLDREVAALTICNRSLARAEELAMALGKDKAGRNLAVAPWEDASARLMQADLVINATSLGMKGQPPLTLDWPDDLRGRIVSDIVYAPLETDLLRDGRLRGARVVDGLGMLLHQAAFAFEFWFGRRPAVTPALWRRIADDIEGVRR